MYEYGSCFYFSYVHIVSSLIRSNPSSTETRNLLPYVMVCITVKKISRKSVLLVFSVITKAARTLVFLLDYATLLRETLGNFVYSRGRAVCSRRFLDFSEFEELVMNELNAIVGADRVAGAPVAPGGLRTTRQEWRWHAPDT